MTTPPSSGFTGADVDALCVTAASFGRAAEVLLEVSVRITLRLSHSLIWNGADAARARQQWESDALPGIAGVVGALRSAGLALAAEAEAQVVASEAQGAPATDAGPPAAPRQVDTLIDDVRTLRDTLMQLPNVVSVAGVPALTTFEKFGLSGLGHVGTVMDAAGLYQAVRDGDLAQGTQSGVSLGIAGAGLVGVSSATTGGLGLAWWAGTEAGTHMYEGMQGTRYGDIVREMTDSAFDENGAWGIAQVPGILGFAAWERFTEDPPEPGQSGGGR